MLVNNVWLNAPNAEKCRRPELDYCPTLGDTLTLETITAVGKAFQDAYNLRRLQRTKDPNATCVYSAAGALRTSTYSWLERKVQKRGIGEMLPVWVGS
ncbi:hypothetical protein DPMN_125496 [Dreissena polymorpha]|uniref:Uncharacterized protein n=1 Tax=Dreissena polymorpha TaxID=45954 RepID=A0A9D4JX86_DREPO|nr:hypothetical protein DPMN_125496 [Dreissena polymorpha]